MVLENIFKTNGRWKQIVNDGIVLYDDPVLKAHKCMRHHFLLSFQLLLEEMIEE